MDFQKFLSTQRRVFRIAKPQIKFFSVGVLSMILGVQLGLLIPVIVGWFIDSIVVNHRANELWAIVISLLGVTVLKGLFDFGNRYFNEKGGELSMYKLRNQLFQKLQSHSLTFIQSRSEGNILSRMTADLDVIKSYLSRDFRLGISAIYYYFSIGVIIYLTLPLLILFYLVLVPFLFLISWVYGRKVRPIIKERRKTLDRVSTHIQEKVANVDIVQAFTMEKYELDRFHDENKLYRDLAVKSLLIRGSTLPLATVLVSVAGVAIIWFGSVEIVTNPLTGLTIGQIVSLNLLMIQLRTPTRLFGNFISGVNSVQVSADRVFDILYSDVDIRDKENPLTQMGEIKEITYNKVTVTIKERKILSDITLKFKGETVNGILGSSGSGKTTLINLLPRFQDPQEGSILINGVNIRDYSLKTLRQNISIVNQENFLFNKSILENLLFSNQNVSMDEVVKYTKIAQIHKFISSLPEAYDTIIGERGITLSGGQQQRLSIARALLSRPKIIIFDDSTSSLDAGTELIIQEELQKLEYKVTMIIISQKISSVRYADYVCLLDQGEIIEQGNPSELLNSEGLYRKIYSLQRLDSMVVEEEVQ